MSTMVERVAREEPVRAVGSATEDDEGFESAAYRLSELKHLCAFVDEVIRSLPGKQIDEIRPQGLTAAFSMLAECAGVSERRSPRRDVAAQVDALDATLHRLEHFCGFLCDLPRVLSDNGSARLVAVRAETVFMMFAMVSDRLELARKDLAQIRALAASHAAPAKL